jgi:transposase
MEKITTVGLDLAKQVMAVHAVDAPGRPVMRKALRRDQLLGWSAALAPCVIAMEACGGAHYWARELVRQGHTVRIIAAELVRPFRKSGKNDANDAEAICTAARQANMRFVSTPSKLLPRRAVARSRSGCRPSPGLAPRRLRRWWRAWANHRNFAMAASSRRGWG